MKWPIKYSLGHFATERAFTLAGLILGLAILAGLGLLAYQQRAEEGRERQLFKATRDIVEQTQALSAAMPNTENELRGYILTRDAAFLNSYHMATAAIPHLLQELQSRLHTVPGQDTDLSTLRSSVTQKLDELQSTIELAKTDPQQALGQIQIHHRNQLTQQLQQDLHAIQTRALETLEGISDNERHAARQAFQTILSGAILGAILLITATLLVLRDSNAKEQAYRLLEQVELLNLVPIMTRSLDGTIIFWSEGFERLYGWTADHAIGHNAHELLNTTFPLPLGEMQKSLLSNGEWSGELTQRREDGEAVIVAATWTLVRPAQGRLPAIVEVHSDISRMKQSEAARQESQARLSLLADNMSQFAWMADEKGWLFWYNQRWFDYSGTTLEEMQGWGWEKVHHPDHLQRVIDKWQQALEAGEAWEDTFPLRGQDGQYRWFLSRAVPIRDHEGKIFRWFGTNTDITELREAQLARSQLAAIVEESTDAIISKTPDGRIMTWNQGAAHLFGYVAQDVIGRSVEVLVPSDLREEELRLRAIVRSGGYVTHIESQRLHKDGRRIDVSISMSSIKDSEGRIIGASQTMRDITERKQAQRSLETSERFNRILFESSPDCVKVIESSGRLLTMNMQGMCAMEIEDFEAVRGTMWTQLWPTEAQDIIQIALDKCRKGELATFRGFCPTAKGTARWWDVVVSPIQDGSGRMLAVSRDMTEQQRVQEAMKASEERFRALTTTIPQLVWTTTSDGFCNYISEQWLAYTGTTMDDNLGTGWLSSVHPEDVPGVTRTWKAAVGSGSPYVAEYRLRAADGSYRWHLARGVAQRDARQRIVHWVGTTTDISSQKEHEAALERINALLEAKREALAAANKELEAFSYSVSHDLRAPLRTMSGFAQALLEDFGDRLDPEAIRYLDLIDNGAKQLGRLIDDLLSFSRLSRQGFTISTVSLAELLDEVRSELAAETANRAIDWVVSDMPTCRADRMTLKLVLANLVGNALKYSRPRNPARIEIRAESVEDQPGYIMVSIKDNGVGFDMRYADKLFTVFQRLHRSEEFEGTGIGLAIVQRIIHRHGGRVSGEGRVGEGATFRFTVERA